MSQSICYGDQIYLELSLLHAHSSSQARLLSSKSFLDDEVYAVKTSNYKLADFRSCVFTVLPPLVNDQDDLGFIESLERELSLLSTSTAEYKAGQDYLKKQLETRREQLHEMREDIKVLNAKLAEEKAQKEVLFGEIVVLQHLETGNYLSVEISRNVRARNLNGLRLQKDATPGCYFRIHSATIEHERGMVEYTREIKLVSVQLGTMMAMSRPEDQEIDKTDLGEIGLEEEDKEVELAMSKVPVKRTMLSLEDLDVEEKFVRSPQQRMSEKDAIDFDEGTIRGKKGAESFEEENYEVGTSVESEDFSRIRFFEYCSRKSQESFKGGQIIKSGDYVRFEIEDMFLTAVKTPRKHFVTCYGAYREEWNTHNLVDSVFQIISYHREKGYPKGDAIKSVPKGQVNEAGTAEKVVLKHLMTGQYLTVPEEGLVQMDPEESDKSEGELKSPVLVRAMTELPMDRAAQLGFFKLVNNDLKAESNHIAKGALVGLVVYKGEEERGKWYMTRGRAKKKQQTVDSRLEHFVGRGNTFETVQGVLHTKMKDLTVSQDTGRFFKIDSLEEVEIRRIMEFANYGKAIGEMEDTMQDVILGDQTEATKEELIEKIEKISGISERLLRALKGGEGAIHEVLSGFEGDVHTLVREFKILDSICRLLWWFFVKQRIHSFLREKEKSGDLDFSYLVKLLKNFIYIILESTRDTLVTHLYLAQYLRVFLMSLLSPSTLLEKLTKDQRENLKSSLTVLLSKLISDRTLHNSPIVSQLNTYQGHIFMHIDAHSDYSTYILQLLSCFFSARPATAQDTLLRAFITRYLSNQSDLQLLFPQINSLTKHQDFQIQFVRTGYPETMIMSSCPAEVLEYLYWAFSLLNALLDSGSLRVKYAVLKYYDIWVCWDLITSHKVPAKLKSKVLGVVRKAHLGYKKLPIERIPIKLRFNINSETLKSYLEALESSIKETRENLLRPLEKDYLEGTTLQEQGTFRLRMEGIREKILQSELESLMHGKLQELAFGLEVMESVLESGVDVKDEELLKMYQCVAEIVWRAAQEIGGPLDKSPYYKALLDNYEQILSLLIKLDQYMVTRAVQEILDELHQGLEKADAPFRLYPFGQDFSKDLNKNVDAIFTNACEGWKSKERLYSSTRAEKIYTETYSEATLRKGLWRVLEVEPAGLASGIIGLLRRKVGFEAEVSEELSKFAFISKESELMGIVELATNVLNLYKQTRHLQAEVEFETKDMFAAQNTQMLGEVIRNLENIILIVYDYEAHIRDEPAQDPHKGPRRSFLERLSRCKRRESGVEIPFEYKEKYIKKDFQKALRMFNANKVVLMLLDYLDEPELFGVTPQDEGVVMASALVGVILRLFVEGDVVNKHLLSGYSRFMQVFHDKSKLSSTLEFLGIFSEVCVENKILVNIEEIPVYRVTLEYFVSFLQDFSLIKDASQADSYLSAMIIGNSHFLFLSHLPKDTFSGVRLLNSILGDLLEFIGVDKRLAPRELLEHATRENSAIKIYAPPLYSILKEFWKLMTWLATMEKKENVLIMQSRFIGTMLQSFLMNQNMLFHMEMKRLMLGSFETLHYKTQYINEEVFESEDTLDSVMECLLVDVYWYLREKLRNTEGSAYVLEVLESGNVIKLNPRMMIRYRDLFEDPATGIKVLESVEFYEYQSVSRFEDMWRDYVYYLLCEFLYSLVDNYRKYFTEVRSKNVEIKNLFELWARMLLKLREVEKEHKYIVLVDEVLKKAMVLSEYSMYKNFSFGTEEFHDVEKRKLQEDEDKKIKEAKLREERKAKDIVKMDDAVQLIINHFQPDSHYKWKKKLTNIMDVARDLEKRRGLISQLVMLLKKRSTSGKDVRFIIRILRRVVEFEIISVEGDTKNDNANKPIYLWKALSSEHYDKIRGVQNLLNDKNIVEAIFELLYRQAGNPKLVREALTLSITLLYGGNKNVQNSFYDFFKVDFENTILDNISDLLEEIIDDLLSLEERRLKRNYYSSLKFLFKYFGERNMKFSKETRVHEDTKHEVAQLFYKELDARDRKRAVSTKSFRLVLVIFTFLQLLCEGHNAQFQEFLRDQRISGHAKSFNILAYVKELYQEYYRNLSGFSIELGIKSLDLMIEMQQGPSKANNEILLTESLVYTLFSTLYSRNTASDLDLLARGFEFRSDEENYLELKVKASILLLGIFEKGDVEYHKNMGKYIDFKLCIRTIRDCMITYLTQKVKHIDEHGKKPRKTLQIGRDDVAIEDIWNPYLQMAMNAYMILRYLSLDEPKEEFMPEIRQAINEVTGHDAKDSEAVRLFMYIMKFLEDYTASIEIYNNKTGQLSRVYFPVTVDFFYMTDETRENFSENVDRSNTQTKVADLSRRSEHLMSHMELEYISRHRPFNLNYNKLYESLRDVSHLIAVALAILMVLVLKQVDGQVTQPQWSWILQCVLNSIQVIISFLLIMLFKMTRLTKHLTNMWERYVEQSITQRGTGWSPIPPGATQGTITTTKDGDIILKLKGPNFEQSVRILSKRFWGYNLLFILRSKIFVWHLFYFAICVLSLFNPIISALQLLDITLNSDTVSRITIVIWHNAQQFIWTITMLLITIYIYTMIAFFYLKDRFISDKYGNLCDDTYECFISILNIGLRAGGGIAEEIEATAYDPNDRVKFLVYSLFDLSFYIIIILMLLNFIFGMIIDAFVELRNRKNRVDEDKKNVCFICGIQRSEYERFANFDRHIEEEHNHWHYIAYLLYLRHKSKVEPTEMTDTENYVLGKYLEKDSTWIPIGRSIILERQQEKQEKAEEEVEEEKAKKDKIDDHKKYMSDELEALKSQMKTNFDKIFSKLK